MKIVRCVVMLLVLVVCFNVNAQEAIAIAPSELVNAHKEELAPLTPVTLFDTQNSRNYPDLDLNEYQILALNSEERAAMLALAPTALKLQIPYEGNTVIDLDLVQVNLPDFIVRTASDNIAHTTPQAIHYRGIVAGDPNSLVAISVWDGEMAGMISSDRFGGNLILGKLKQELNPTGDAYALYQDKEIFQDQLFSCGTPDSGIAYTDEELRPAADGRGPNDCVRIYLEVDHDIYQNKGGLTATTQFISALFNQVATLYANDQISLVLSELLVWDVSSPYTGATSGDMLTQFQGTRNNFNGDLGQLVSFGAPGGIAVVDGLCHPYSLAKLSYAGISSIFEQVPTYSWSVMVMAHELGHLLGSQHTHACVWNGNNTALDNCPGYTEGGCGSPGAPSNGGTIMSYCHLNAVGINFTNGFGAQPGTLLRNKVLAATCLSTCSTGGGGTGGGGGDPTSTCSQEQLYIQIKLDTYSPETTWKLTNNQGAVVANGGPYIKPLAGTVIIDTLCLPQGCYAFTIMDSYGDGICCDYGQGLYLLKDVNNQIIASGGEFPASEQTDFCLPYDPNAGNDDCVSINFNDYNVVSYGTNQDGGSYQVQENGNSLFIQNNAWKAIAMNYEVTENTMVAFDFKSSLQGEIHGLGFDNNDGISFSQTFRVHGLQSWGIAAFDNYGNNGSWQSFEIPVGQYYTGLFDRLFFVADHDGGARNGNSWFRNVRIYEGTDCNTNLNNDSANLESVNETGRMNIYPNPVTSDQLQLTIDTPVEGNANWSIISLTGQELRQQQLTVSTSETHTQINTSSLLPGTYLLRWRDAAGEQTMRFAVQR